MQTALPSSDYYGDSVAMSDIQRHLPNVSVSGFLTFRHYA